MAERGFILFFNPGEDPWDEDLPVPPGRLLCNASLDQDLDQLTDAIRGWVLRLGSATGDEAKPHHLHITIMGPMNDPAISGLLKTPQQQITEALEALAAAQTGEERFHVLHRVAKLSYEMERFEDALRFTMELNDMLPEFEGVWGYADACAGGKTILGRLALREGKVREAEKLLLESGALQGTPSRSSFGPNMGLAHDLLLKGRRKVVLDYFQLCRAFWNSEFSQLDEWTEEVKRKRIPDFGGNMVY